MAPVLGHRQGTARTEMPIVFSPQALDDLQAVRDYISLDNPYAASRVAVQLVTGLNGCQNAAGPVESAERAKSRPSGLT